MIALKKTIFNLCEVTKLKMIFRNIVFILLGNCCIMYSLCPATTFTLDETTADIAKHDALCYPPLEIGSSKANDRTTRVTDYIQIGKIYLSGSQNSTL